MIFFCFPNIFQSVYFVLQDTIHTAYLSSFSAICQNGRHYRCAFLTLKCALFFFSFQKKKSMEMMESQPMKHMYLVEFGVSGTCSKKKESIEIWVLFIAMVQKNWNLWKLQKKIYFFCVMQVIEFAIHKMCMKWEELNLFEKTNLSNKYTLACIYKEYIICNQKKKKRWEC